MSDLTLRYYPDPVLRTAAAPIAKVTPELREVAAQMFKIMYLTRGIGLAGPQVGLAQRIVVANLGGEADAKEGERVYINPQIVDAKGELREEEGCLSLPGLYARVTRSAELRVRYYDLDETLHEVDAVELESRMFQHEIDHLDGVLIIDKISAAELDYWKPLLKELDEEFRAKKKPRARAESKAAL